MNSDAARTAAAAVPKAASERPAAFRPRRCNHVRRSSCAYTPCGRLAAAGGARPHRTAHTSGVSTGAAAGHAESTRSAIHSSLARRMRPAAQVPEPAISTPGAESWVAGVVRGVMGRCPGLVWTAQHAHRSPQRAVEVVKMEVSIATTRSSNRHSQETIAQRRRGCSLSRVRVNG